MSESNLSIAHDHSDERQKRSLAWAVATYGERAKGSRYQAFRFLEEALELAQTQGLNLDDFIRAARYVAERKVGQTSIEIGDVRFCLDILAENLGISVDGAHATCLNRVKGIPPEKLLEKDDAKCAAGLI